MINRFTSIFIMLIFSTTVFAQMNYSFSASTATYASISGGTSPFLSGNGIDQLADEGYATNIPIGFSFNYNNSGVFTQVSISTNGFISFADLTDAYVVNNLTSGVVGQRPIVAPLWDDINLQTTANLKYTTTGSAPSRIFTVEWLNARWGFGASSACISFQVKLYETSNWVEFAYRQESGTPASPSASVGLTAVGTGNSNFISLSNLSVSPIVSVSNEVNSISTKPNTNQSFIFKPGTLPITINSFNVSKEKGVHYLQWQTVSEINNSFFEVQRSANGIQFTTINQLMSKAIDGNSSSVLQYNYADIKPLDGINYYRIKQTDKDGKFSFSSIISIKNNTNDLASISLYPNPVKNKLNIQLNNAGIGQISISVLNAFGQQVIQKNNLISTNNNIISLDVSQLVTGIYSVKVVNNETNKSYTIKRFVK
jgi:hypothetical protein